MWLNLNRQLVSTLAHTQPNKVRNVLLSIGFAGAQAYRHLAHHSSGSDWPHRQPPVRLRLEYTGSLGMPAANSAGRWASCRHAETFRDHTLLLYDFALAMAPARYLANVNNFD